MNLFSLFMGILCILFAVFYNPLLRLVKYKPISERFTTPRYRRSALINKRLGRVLFALFGLSWLADGVGPLLLPSTIAVTIGFFILGLAIVVAVTMIGVRLFHWNADGST